MLIFRAACGDIAASRLLQKPEIPPSRLTEIHDERKITAKIIHHSLSSLYVNMSWGLY